MEEHKDKKLIFSNEVAYSCHSSGDCCRHDWIIGIDEQSLARVKQLDWHNINPSYTWDTCYQPLLKPIPSGEKFTFSRTDCGACVFLDENNHCRMHQHFGFEVKPQVCKEFPYYFMETPDGVVVGLSFACGSVRNFKGSLLAEKEEEIRHVLAGSYRVKQFPANLELYSGIPLPWEEYKLLEESLLAIIHNKNQTFSRTLLTGHILAGMVALSLKQVEIQAQAKGEAPKETFTGGLQKLQGDKFRALLKIADSIKPPKRISHQYLAPYYTWLQFSRYEWGRLGLVWNLYRNYYKFQKGRGRLEGISRGDADIQLETVLQIRFSDENSQIDDFLRKYWGHVIFRKNLLTILGVFRGYQTLICLYGMMKWLSQLEAYQHNHSEVTLEDIKESVKILEQKFILHSQFPKLFTLHPVLTQMLDRMYMRQSFAPSILLER
jgi:Fe-S-cluster containining protein